MYICFIFFGIILFLLWNRINKFSVGVPDDPTCTNISEERCNEPSVQSTCPDMCSRTQELVDSILVNFNNEITNNCDGKDFSIMRDYAIRGINNDYDCCTDINEKLQLLNIGNDQAIIIQNLLKENTDYMTYDLNKRKNILEYIIGCNHPNTGCGDNREYLDITYGDDEDDNIRTSFRCIRPCEVNLCQNGGTCSDNGYCNCPDSYKGASCEISSPPPPPPPPPTNDPCSPNPCENSGTCNELTQGERNDDYPYHYNCVCQDGFSGYNCENESGIGPGWWVVGGIGLCAAAAYYNRPNIQDQPIPQSDEDLEVQSDEDLEVSVPVSNPAPVPDTSGYSPTPHTGDETTQLYQLPLSGTGTAPSSLSTVIDHGD